MHRSPTYAPAMASDELGRVKSMLDEQVDAVIGLLRDVFGDEMLGVYLYGSALVGGLRPASDVDVFVVTGRSTTAEQRANLVEKLRPISARALRPPGWRPVELTVVVQSNVEPWRYPPRMDFQSGEWMRVDFDSGASQPWPQVNPDLAVMIAMIRQASRPLIGPPATDLLPEIPRSDLALAMTDGIDSLLADLDTDTTNVLLTLARIWHTLATTEFATKDVAAEWAMERAPRLRRVLEAARVAYLEGAVEAWTAGDLTVVEAAREIVRAIRRAS